MYTGENITQFAPLKRGLVLKGFQRSPQGFQQTFLIIRTVYAQKTGFPQNSVENLLKTTQTYYSFSFIFPATRAIPKNASANKSWTIKPL